MEISRKTLKEDKEAKDRTADAVVAIVFGVINGILQMAYIILVIVNEIEGVVETHKFGILQILTYLFPCWQLMDTIFVIVGINDEVWGRKLKVYCWISLVIHFILGLLMIISRIVLIWTGPIHEHPTLLEKYPVAILIFVLINYVAEVLMLFFYLSYYPDYTDKASHLPIMLKDIQDQKNVAYVQLPMVIPQY